MFPLASIFSSFCCFSPYPYIVCIMPRDVAFPQFHFSTLIDVGLSFWFLPFLPSSIILLSYYSLLLYTFLTALIRFFILLLSPLCFSFCYYLSLFFYSLIFSLVSSRVVPFSSSSSCACDFFFHVIFSILSFAYFLSFSSCFHFHHYFSYFFLLSCYCILPLFITIFPYSIPFGIAVLLFDLVHPDFHFPCFAFIVSLFLFCPFTVSFPPFGYYFCFISHSFLFLYY